jgi:hypothetical protein
MKYAALAYSPRGRSHYSHSIIYDAASALIWKNKSSKHTLKVRRYARLDLSILNSQENFSDRTSGCFGKYRNQSTECRTA